MPRTEKENAKIRAKRKNEILDAAIEVFAKKGYEKTSCDDINKKVGCSHGLFYRYFQSKDDIYNALVEKYKDYYINQFNSIIETPNEAPQITLRKLTGFFIDSINKSKKDAYITFIVLTAPIVKSAIKKELIKKLLASLVSLIMKIKLEDGSMDEKNATSYAMSFYYMLIGMCYTRINFSVSRGENYREIEDVFLKIISQSTLK